MFQLHSERLTHRAVHTTGAIRTLRALDAIGAVRAHGQAGRTLTLAAQSVGLARSAGGGGLRWL
jgi:hypothetical protein